MLYSQRTCKKDVKKGLLFLKPFMKKEEIGQIENIFRQIAEEKPYLIAPFNEKKFFEESKRVLGNDIPLTLSYVRDWLSGYRKKKSAVN